MMQPILIFKGDDTDAFGVKVITINLKTSVDLSKAAATNPGKFELLSFSKTFTKSDIVSKKLTFSIPAEKTKGFPVGTAFGKLTIVDNNGKTLVPTCAIPFSIALPGLPANSVRSALSPDSEVTVTIGIDYDQAFNKPTIEGVTVEGAKTASDFGLAKATDVPADYVISATKSADGKKLTIKAKGKDDIEFTGGGGEPDAYLKSASVSTDGSTLTITPKTGDAIQFKGKPDGYDAVEAKANAALPATSPAVGLTEQGVKDVLENVDTTAMTSRKDGSVVKRLDDLPQAAVIREKPDEPGVYEMVDGKSIRWDSKQDKLVSGTNIKTVNNKSLLGAGNITAADIGADAAGSAAAAKNAAIADAASKYLKVTQTDGKVETDTGSKAFVTKQAIFTDSTVYIGTGVEPGDAYVYMPMPGSVTFSGDLSHPVTGISVDGVPPCEPEPTGDCDISFLFGSDNTALQETVASGITGDETVTTLAGVKSALFAGADFKAATKYAKADAAEDRSVAVYTMSAELTSITLPTPAANAVTDLVVIINCPADVEIPEGFAFNGNIKWRDGEAVAPEAGYTMEYGFTAYDASGYVGAGAKFKAVETTTEGE